jgi:hypothetical protein
VLEDLIPLSDAAEKFGVSRRRVQAMITAGVLAGERHGAQWFVPVDAVQLVDNTRLRSGGRRLRSASSREIIAMLGSDPRHLHPDELDALCRRLRARARW